MENKIVGTKEFNLMLKSIDRWIKSEKGNVSIFGSFVSFDKDQEVKNDIMIGYGSKKVIKLQLTEFTSQIKKEKEEFINW